MYTFEGPLVRLTVGFDAQFCISSNVSSPL